MVDNWFFMPPGYFGGEEAFDFLLKADFTGPDIAAGSVPASLGEPYVTVGGPLAKTEIAPAEVSISNNKLVLKGDGTDYNKAKILSNDAALFDSAGYCHYLAYETFPASGARAFFVFATGARFNRQNSMAVTMVDGGPSITDTIGTNRLLLIRRSVGAFVFFQRVTDGTPLLHWIVPTATSSHATPYINQYDAVIQNYDTWRVADLPANGYGVFDHRDLDVTSSIASPVVGNVWQHTPDFLFRVTCTTLSVTDVMNFGFHWNGSITDSVLVQITTTGGLVLRDNNTVIGTAAAGSVVNGDTLSVLKTGSTYKVFANGVLKINASLTINAGTGTVGKFQYSGSGYSFANLTVRTLDGVANVSSANHPGYGLATAVLPGPRAGGDTFTHEADCHLEWELPAIPTVGNAVIRFRRADDNNWLNAYVDAAGALRLGQMVGGSFSVKATYAGPVAAGSRLVVVANGTSVKVFVGTTLAVSDTASSALSANTGGVVYDLGTGGRISNLIAWPLNLASAPNTGGAADALEALTRMGE